MYPCIYSLTQNLSQFTIYNSFLIIGLQTSIYEVISGKNAALSEERSTLMSAVKHHTTKSTTQHTKAPLTKNTSVLNSTFTR